jgi:LAO/AO transport system kinase
VPAGDGVAELVARAHDGDPRAVARLVTLVEDGSAVLPELAGRLAGDADAAAKAQVVGVTGAPGVGKSTLTSALIGCYRASGARVAVVAVDPSSPFSGGALLGDRVRMQEHAADTGVFIRSMAARGRLGGLAWATPQAVRVLASVGFEVVLLETVGVGQSEVDVAATADTVVVVVAPGMGDGVQAAKAGILEIGDVYVVNKGDRDGAEIAAREIRDMLRLGPVVGPEGWDRPVLRTTASDGTGVRELVDALAAHRAWGERTGELTVRRRRRAADEIVALVTARLVAASSEVDRGSRLDDLAEQVRTGQTDPYRAATALLDGAAPAAG